MKTLQKLIDVRMAEGKSMRQIAKEAGIEYRSLSDYYHQKTAPKSKNLAALSKYFNVPFYEIMEEYIPENQRLSLSGPKQILAGEAPTLTDDEAQLLLDLLRTVRSRKGKVPRED